MSLTNRCFDEVDKIICSCSAAACSERRGLLAMAMEKVAREFAADSIRGLTWTGVTVSSFSGLRVVMINLPNADGLFGLGFSRKEDAEAWREKAIGMAVDAAAVKR